MPWLQPCLFAQTFVSLQKNILLTNMSNTEPTLFDHFLSFFPEVTLPITLADETHHDFSAHNEPIPQELIDLFLVPHEPDHDEHTEYIACIRIPQTYQFHAIVYWKAGLLSYQYFLATFTEQGELIQKRALAGTYAADGKMTQSVATIDEDWIIYVVSGQLGAGQTSYEAASSTAYKLELLPEGQIIYLTD